ncbi:hypothetical protein ACFTAO_03550 [Paenibacillus rhizoplanae]
MKLKVVPVPSITANGDYQEVTVNVPNGSVLEANISIMSSKPVTAKLSNPAGKEVAIPSDKVLLSKSSSYTLIKLLSPEEGGTGSSRSRECRRIRSISIWYSTTIWS